jgi:hydrogenase expression/formation protein HypC
MCLGSVGKVIRTWEESGVPMAEVDFGHRADEVCLLYHPEVTVDTVVLVHMGFVMEELDEERATDALALRKEIAGV